MPARIRDRIPADVLPELEAWIAERIAALEERLGKNSTNSSKPRAPVTVGDRRGGSPRRGVAWPPVPEGNCVAARRGGEQPEGKVSSATEVNSIRHRISASLRG